VYTEDMILSLVANTPTPSEKTRYELVREPQPNPYGVIPVFHFSLDRRSGTGELTEGVLSLQDAMNKLLNDMMVSSEYCGFPQRWAIGNFATDTKWPVSPGSILELPGASETDQPVIVGTYATMQPDVYVRSMDDLTLTRAGEVFGSLAWMAPEQAAGEWQRVDALSDVHALGAILFFLAAGEPVFAPEMPVAAQWAAAQSGDRPSLRKRVPSVPRDLAAIADRCMHPEKSQRYGSVAELEEDIRRWLAGEPVLARRGAGLYWLGKKARKHWVPAGASAVLLAGAAGLAIERERERARIRLERATAAERTQHEMHEELSRFLAEVRLRYADEGKQELARAFEQQVAQFPWSFEVAGLPYDPRRSQGRAALSRAVKASQRGEYPVAAQSFSDAMARLQPLVAQHPEVTV
jgi:hypothetical protein